MKKTIFIILCICFTLGLCACNAQQSDMQQTLGTEEQDTLITEPFWEMPTDSGGSANDYEEARYQDALQRLQYHIRDSKAPVMLEEEDGKYLMEEFAALGDYKDSLEILSRFSVVEDQLISTKETGWDRMGNEKGVSSGHYVYDRFGRVIQTDDSEISRRLGIMRSSQDILYITYGENGQIQEVILEYFDEVKLKGTPVYDETGNMTQMNIMRNDGDFVATFEYDNENRLVRILLPDEWQRHEYTWEICYTYDDAGQLIRRTMTEQSWNKTKYVSDFIYEDGKKIRTETVRTSQTYDTVTTVYEFTYDEEGRIVSDRFTTDDPNELYPNTECIYTYGDCYIYTPEP